MTTGFSGKYVACPKCRAEGKDRTGNHLSLFKDGTAGWCTRHHGLVKLDGEGDQVERGQNYGNRYENKLDVAIINRLPIRALEDRCISKETAEKFGVRVSVDEQTGEIDAHFYPYVDSDGNVVGYKKRALPKQFSVIGKIKGLFGQHLCKGGKFVVLCEGELDACAAWEMLQQEGKSFNCVSIPNGANEDGKVDNTTLRELEWLGSFEGIALCLDQDAPGQATAKQLADVLASVTKVKIVKLPHKDAGEMLKKGKSKEFLKCLYDAKAYHPEQIVEGHTIDVAKLRTPKQPGFDLPYPKLNKMMHGLRKGEISLVSAGSGIGKSSLVREIGYHLSLNGYKIAVIALETPMEDAARMFVAMDNNVPAYRLIFNPTCIPQKDYEDSCAKLFGTDQINFFSHWGSIAADELIRKCQYYVKALGVDFIILDHISMVIAGNSSSDERKDIDVLFENLNRLVVETGVGVLAVMHLKRVQGKSYNKGDEVELTDLRGCVDKDTEFLSQDGWKPISQYSTGDSVFVVDSLLCGGFTSENQYVKLPCTEGLFNIRTNRLDMCLSSEHRIAHFTERDKNNIKFTAVSSALDKDYKFPTGFRGLIPCTLNNTLEKERFPGGEAALRVQVMMNADGWIRNKKTLRSSIRVKKERKVDRARILLSNYTKDFYEFSGGEGYREFSFTPPKDKGFDSWYYNLCIDDLLIIADEVRYWDGELTTGRFSSISKADADFIQFVYTLTGKRSTLSVLDKKNTFNGKYNCKTQYRVTPTGEKLASFRNCPNSKKVIEKTSSIDGYKYCFTTPTGMWLARRNGKIFVTGNSAGAEQMSWTVLALERNQQSEEKKDLVKLRLLKNRTTGFTGIADTLLYNHETGRLELFDPEHP